MKKVVTNLEVLDDVKTNTSLNKREFLLLCDYWNGAFIDSLLQCCAAARDRGSPACLASVKYQLLQVLRDINDNPEWKHLVGKRSISFSEFERKLLDLTEGEAKRTFELIREYWESDTVLP